MIRLAYGFVLFLSVCHAYSGQLTHGAFSKKGNIYYKQNHNNFTHSFQAIDFYIKQGLVVIACFDNYLLGYDRVYLRKDLN